MVERCKCCKGSGLVGELHGKVQRYFNTCDYCKGKGRVKSKA